MVTCNESLCIVMVFHAPSTPQQQQQQYNTTTTLYREALLLCCSMRYIHTRIQRRGKLKVVQQQYVAFPHFIILDNNPSTWCNKIHTWYLVHGINIGGAKTIPGTYSTKYSEYLANKFLR